MTQQLRNDQLGAVLDAYEAEHGAFSKEEMHAARRAIRGDAHPRG